MSTTATVHPHLTATPHIKAIQRAALAMLVVSGVIN